jgi:ABC-type sugar transport system permease subunit
VGVFAFGIGFALWVAAISELVGLPVAWLKVRRTRCWRERPAGVRGIDLLERFIRPILWEGVAVALVVFALVALLVWALGLGDTTAGKGAYALVFAIPAILVGVAVWRLDPEEFAKVTESAA